jgi:hypothetical protein|tara:strand:+ start:547 stop:711 length:165 start_codon:yes stop_codon:yes gene_type:complete
MPVADVNNALIIISFSIPDYEGPSQAKDSWGDAIRPLKYKLFGNTTKLQASTTS